METPQKPPKRKDIRGRGRPHRKLGAAPGRPSKYSKVVATGLAKAVAEGVPIVVACRARNINQDTFHEWLNTREDFASALAQAKEAEIIRALTAIKTCTKMDEIKGWLFWLVQVARDHFSPPQPASVALHLNQQFNHLSTQAELEEARKRLDETKALQLARGADERSGNSHEETRARRPIIEIDSHVEHAPLALEVPPEEPAPEPERVAPPVSQAPPEPHVRQQDRKPPVGPLSERQRQRLEQEKARRGGEGKNPFG